MSGGAYFNSLDRYELKYIIPKELIEPITEYLLAYSHLDYHSSISPNGFYSINSLYFDTPNYTFLKNRLYKKNPRFNMRARSYGYEPKEPYFLEIKYKASGTVRKYRSKITQFEWENLFTNPDYRTNEFGSEKERENKELFYKTALKYQATPKIMTQYHRRAFVSDLDEYVRVTMDINMSCYKEESYILKPDLSKLIPYDSQKIYAKEAESNIDGSVILELKCYPNSVPIWLLDLIRIFELERTSFSKYIKSTMTLAEFEPFNNSYYNFNDRCARGI